MGFDTIGINLVTGISHQENIGMTSGLGFGILEYQYWYDFGYQIFIRVSVISIVIRASVLDRILLEGNSSFL